MYDFLGSNFKLKDPLLSVVNFEVELSVINSKLILEGANLLPIFTGISFSTNSTVGFSGWGVAFLVVIFTVSNFLSLE